MSTTLTTELTIVNIQREQLQHEPALIITRLTATQQQELKDFLLDIIEDKDGSPSIGQLYIKHLTFDINDSHKGKFRLAFDIERRFCCSGTEACQQDYIDFNFVLVENTLKAQATYFNWALNN